MKITFDLNAIDELAFLKKYANSIGCPDFNIFINAMIKNYSERLQKKSDPNSWESKKDSYFINDFIKEQLKFQYGISRYGDVICFQFGKEKTIKISTDVSSGIYYIYLLKKGCPNKCDMATLQNYSIRFNLEEIYEKVYGKGTFKQHAEEHVKQLVEASQIEWKNRGKRK